MTNTIIFVANGFNRDNVRLQPWRYVYELAKHKNEKNNVIVITEGGADLSIQSWEEGFDVVETKLLNIRQQLALGRYIKSLSPSELWWSTTPRSIAFYPVLKNIECKKIAFITCPLYRWSELIRASFSGVPYKQTKALWKQRLIPRFLFRFLLNSKLFNSVTVQSKNNKSILEKDGIEKSKIKYLPVGIDNEDMAPVDKAVLKLVANDVNKRNDDIVFLYLGALRPIRGFDALIKAFPAVIDENSNARLVILARGASEEKCNNILSSLQGSGIDERVSIVGGWLTRSQIWAYIELSDIVVLPFVLVPSDIPIAVLESLARGKPVIVSPVDGLPELAQGRGIVVNPLAINAFSEEMNNLAKDKKKLFEYTQAAIKFMKSYPRWKDVGDIMEEISNEA